MTRLLPWLLLALLAGCVALKSGKRESGKAETPEQKAESRKQKPELQDAVRLKYLTPLPDEAFQRPETQALNRTALVATPAGFTVRLAWTETEAFTGWRFWGSQDLTTWTVALEGLRPLYGFDFTNTLTGPVACAYYRLEVWR